MPKLQTAGGQGSSLRSGARETISPAPLLPSAASSPALFAILLAYLLLGYLYASRTPAWQVPDEPAHYNVIRQIAQTGALPKLEPGDYDQDYLGRVVGAGFPPDLALDGVQYQDYQPPLYYLLATPVFILFAGALLPLRLFSLILGAGGVIFAFLAVRELFPLRPLLALTAAGFIAFIPQHIAMLAGVNNDSLSELIIALGLWLILRENNRRLKNGCWWLGVVLGLALLTKVQAYVLVPVFALYIILQWRRARPAHTMDWRGLLRWSLTVFGIGLALGALYWGRNWFVCGPADFVCGNWHNHVVIGQPTTREWITEYGWWGREQSLLPRLFKFTFDSFWGVFGWMGVFMPERIYKILLTFTLLLVIGAAGALRPWRVFSMTERDGLTLLAASALTTCALYLYYNFNFVQHQGRYLFPALIPIALAVALSLEQWDKWLVGLMAYTTRNSKLETRLTSHLPSLLSLLLLASLAFLALYRFIIPALPNWG